MNHKLCKLFIVLFVTLMIYSSQDLSAQIIELNAFTGYQLNGKAKLYDGEFRINDSQNYGGKLAYGLSTSTFIELSYMRTDTEGQFFPYGIGTPGDQIAFSSNWIQIGGLQSMELGRVDPYGTVSIGLTVWSPKSSGSGLSSYTQFSATVGAGLKIWLSDMIGIRLQGSMLMPMVYNGVGLGCGIGTGGAGCGGGVYTRITPFQGEFSGGLVIRISPN